MESPEYQVAMFKHAIGDDGLKVIKTFSYSEDENESEQGNCRSSNEIPCQANCMIMSMKSKPRQRKPDPENQ